jgi:hypothetical protein
MVEALDLEFYLLYTYNRLKWSFKLKLLRGVAQFGSAHGLGPWGRGFKSLRPDHIE